METKNDIRKSILIKRNSLTQFEVQKKSEEIFRRLYSLEQYKNARTVIAYLDYKNEVMTRDFIKRCISDGKTIALPKVIPGDNRELMAYEIHSITKDIHSGYKGIPEPKADVLNQVEPSCIDLAVIPGVAFDCSRQRIGYGAGYYDRFLMKLRQDCFKIGVAFSLQILNTIPCDEHDVPMDMIITDTKII